MYSILDQQTCTFDLIIGDAFIIVLLMQHKLCCVNLLSGS